METALRVYRQNSMREQVANSKGTEWMVSSYNAWQKRSPLPVIHQRNTPTYMRLVDSMAQKERQLNGIMSVSYRSILSILAFILSVKSR